nr:tyrosine-type recombinase/integrase [Acidimicrobiia bacterium]
MPTPHITLGEAAEQYLAQRKANCAPSTASNDASVVRRFVKHVGNIQVRHLAPKHVDAWFFGEKGITPTVKEPSSFNNYRKRINTFMGYCAKRGWLRTDPMVNVRVRKEFRRERLHLTAREMLGLLDLAESPRDRAYLAINVNTALRASEITGLRVGDVDLDQGELHVTIVKTAEEDSMPITED